LPPAKFLSKLVSGLPGWLSGKELQWKGKDGISADLLGGKPRDVCSCSPKYPHLTTCHAQTIGTGSGSQSQVRLWVQY